MEKPMNEPTRKDYIYNTSYFIFQYYPLSSWVFIENQRRVGSHPD